MSAEALISRLDRPKPTGRGTWVSRCPAHEDKSPSMTVRELDDGRVLCHCFAGCSVDSILGAVGLDFDALFPPKPIAVDRVAPMRRPFPAADVLEAIFNDMLTVQQVIAFVQAFGEVTPHQRAIMQGAVARIAAARDLVTDTWTRPAFGDDEPTKGSPPERSKLEKVERESASDLVPGEPHLPLPKIMQVPQ